MPAETLPQTDRFACDHFTTVPAAVIPELPADLADQSKMLIHRGRWVWNADLFVLDWQGQRVVLKDFASRSGFIRRFWGRYMAKREARFLARARGIDGIPHLLGRVGSCALLMTRLPGRELSTCTGNQLPPEYFERLTALIDALHQRGIAHGDLNRHNVMIDHEDRPGLVDFEAAVAREPSRGPLRRWAFRIQVRGDHYQLARMKAAFVPQSLTPPERSLAHRQRLGLKLMLVWRDHWRL